MPVKFSKSVVKIDRNTKKQTIEHDYMKSKPLKDLLEYFNKTDNPPKKRQKVGVEPVQWSTRSRPLKKSSIFIME